MRSLIRRTMEFYRTRNEYYLTHVAPIDMQIETVRSNIQKVKAAIEVVSFRLHLFDRDFKRELDLLHVEKSRLYDDMQELKQKKGELFCELDLVQSQISNWHYRADSSLPFYGKKGLKIPERSLFGMCQADLAGFHTDKEHIASQIDNVKSGMNVLYREIQHKKSIISTVKDDRTTLSRLRNEHFQVTAAKSERQELIGQMGRLSAEISLLSQKRKKAYAEKPSLLGYLRTRRQQ